MNADPVYTLSGTKPFRIILGEYRSYEAADQALNAYVEASKSNDYSGEYINCLSFSEYLIEKK